MMSLSQLNGLFGRLSVASVLSRGVHYVPRDPTQIYRGGPKFYIPPESLLKHPPTAFNADPANKTTRDDVKMIYGPQHKLKRTGGRDPVTGKKIFMCRGGGIDRQMREVMYTRIPKDFKGTSLKYRVIQFQECEVRNADLALIAGPTIEYIIQPEGLKVGDVVESSMTKLGSIAPGCAYPLKLLSIGTKVHAIEPLPGSGSKFGMTSGNECEVLQHTQERDRTLVRYTSGVSQWLESDCVATIGRVKQTARAVEPLGSWKASRAKGIKPRRNRQRTENWKKRRTRHRKDQKWAKRLARYFDDRPWAGQEQFTPQTMERFRYHYGDRKPEYFIRRLKNRDPEIMKQITTRKFEPREEKAYQCSWETFTLQRTEVMWKYKQRWRLWKELKRLKK